MLNLLHIQKWNSQTSINYDKKETYKEVHPQAKIWVSFEDRCLCVLTLLFENSCKK